MLIYAYTIYISVNLTRGAGRWRVNPEDYAEQLVSGSGKFALLQVFKISLSLSLYIYIYMYTCNFVYIQYI